MNPGQASPLTGRRSFFRAVCPLLVFVVAVGVLIERYGMPHLLTTYTYQPVGERRMYRTCCYWSVTGSKPSLPGQHGAGCPALVFIPLEKPVLHYVWKGVRSLWTRPQTNSTTEAQ